MSEMSENQLYWEIVGQTVQEIRDFVTSGPPLKWYPIDRNDPKILVKTWTEADHKLWEVIGSKHSLYTFEAITRKNEQEDNGDHNGDQADNNVNQGDQLQPTYQGDEEKNQLDNLVEGIYLYIGIEITRLRSRLYPTTHRGRYL